MNEAAVAVLLRVAAAALKVPGAAVGILRRGEPVAVYCGVEDVRTATPVTAATRFAIGSLTKSMVASALAVLEAERQVSLDDAVAVHVPELARCPWAQTATLRDLLANRSPVPLRAALEFGFDAHDADDDGALARLVTETAEEAPYGEHWSYTNVGWCVLGRAIENVTRLVWEEAMPRLLAPAGLGETTWTTSAVDRAVGHDTSPDGPTPLEPLLCRAFSPAGTAVASTLEDMLRYAAWQLADPTPASQRVVHVEVSIPGWLDAWGLGLARFDWDGLEVWGWDGVVRGQRSVLRLLPDRGGAVVVLSNGSAGRALARSVLTEIVPACFGVKVSAVRLDPLPGAPEQLRAYTGAYGWPDRRVDVTESGHGLLVREGGIAREAVPLDARTFLLDRDDPDTPTIAFDDFDPAGRPGVLYDMVWGLGRLPHHWRQGDQAWTSS